MNDCGPSQAPYRIYSPKVTTYVNEKTNRYSARWDMERLRITVGWIFITLVLRTHIQFDKRISVVVIVAFWLEAGYRATSTFCQILHSTYRPISISYTRGVRRV